jgi:hypothetical protein
VRSEGEEGPRETGSEVSASEGDGGVCEAEVREVGSDARGRGRGGRQREPGVLGGEKAREGRRGRGEESGLRRIRGQHCAHRERGSEAARR